MEKLPRHVISAIATWFNLADWLKVSDPATTIDKVDVTYPFGGMADIVQDFSFGLVTIPPGRLFEVRFYWSGPMNEYDLDAVFGNDDPDLDHYNRLLTSNAITGWDYLDNYPHPHPDARCYVRQFRFGDQPSELVTLTVVAIYVKEPPTTESIESSGDSNWWSARDEG